MRGALRYWHETTVLLKTGGATATKAQVRWAIGAVASSWKHWLKLARGYRMALHGLYWWGLQRMRWSIKQLRRNVLDTAPPKIKSGWGKKEAINSLQTMRSTVREERRMSRTSEIMDREWIERHLKKALLRMRDYTERSIHTDHSRYVASRAWVFKVGKAAIKMWVKQSRLRVQALWAQRIFMKSRAIMRWRYMTNSKERKEEKSTRMIRKKMKAVMKEFLQNWKNRTLEGRLMQWSHNLGLNGWEKKEKLRWLGVWRLENENRQMWLDASWRWERSNLKLSIRFMRLITQHLLAQEKRTKNGAKKFKGSITQQVFRSWRAQAIERNKERIRRRDSKRHWRRFMCLRGINKVKVDGYGNHLRVTGIYEGLRHMCMSYFQHWRHLTNVKMSIMLTRAATYHIGATANMKRYWKHWRAKADEGMLNLVLLHGGESNWNRRKASRYLDEWRVFADEIGFFRAARDISFREAMRANRALWLHRGLIPWVTYASRAALTRANENRAIMWFYHTFGPVMIHWWRELTETALRELTGRSAAIMHWGDKYEAKYFEEWYTGQVDFNHHKMAMFVYQKQCARRCLRKLRTLAAKQKARLWMQFSEDKKTQARYIRFWWRYIEQLLRWSHINDEMLLMRATQMVKSWRWWESFCKDSQSNENSGTRWYKSGKYKQGVDSFWDNRDANYERNRQRAIVWKYTCRIMWGYWSKTTKLMMHMQKKAGEMFDNTAAPRQITPSECSQAGRAAGKLVVSQGGTVEEAAKAAADAVRKVQFYLSHSIALTVTPVIDVLLYRYPNTNLIPPGISTLSTIALVL